MTKKFTVVILSLFIGVLSNCGLFEPDPDPAKLELSVQTLDFGTNSTTQVFSIRNGGEDDLNWNIQSYPDWLTLAPISGKGEMAVTATTDLISLAPGITIGEILISSNAGTQTLPVSIELPLEFLTYDNGPEEGWFTVHQTGAVLWVRFTRPTDWLGCTLRKVELVILQDSTNAPFDIVYQDDYFVHESNYYPNDFIFSTLMNDCSQNSVFKQWDVDKTVFTSKHFFVGIRLLSATGPWLGGDKSMPFGVRSGYNGLRESKNMRVLVPDLNLHIRIFVTRANPRISKKSVPEEEGAWFEATSLDEEISGESGIKIIR